MKEMLEIVESETQVFGKAKKEKDEYDRDYDKGKVKKIKKKREKKVIDFQKLHETKFNQKPN